MMISGFRSGLLAEKSIKTEYLSLFTGFWIEIAVKPIILGEIGKELLSNLKKHDKSLFSQ